MKILLSSLCLVFVFGLAGCSTPSNPTPVPPPQTQQQIQDQTPDITLVRPTEQNQSETDAVISEEPQTDTVTDIDVQNELLQLEDTLSHIEDNLDILDIEENPLEDLE
jgi:uncharacterized lipoprotein YajG